MSYAAVHCDSLTKSFDKVLAVDNMSLDVPEGQILSILGPSGCGKTTLLRLIAGFEVPDAGTVRINGTTVVDETTFVRPEKRRVGMVFQTYALFPHMTVAENISFGLHGSSRTEKSKVVKHWLALTGLTGTEDRLPHELSGGERQRVAVARALAPEPVLLLMDEPFSNLDADRRARVRDEVRFLLKQAQATAVFVTHDQEEAYFMGDLLGVMRAGRLEQLGTPESVFQGPSSRAIAEFLGRAEFLPATVTSGGIRTELGLLDQSPGLEEGSEVEVGFRADDLTFGEKAGGDAMILARYFRGATNLYRIRLASGRIVHSMQPHYRNLMPGTPVRVWFEPNHRLPIFVDGQAVPPD